MIKGAWRSNPLPEDLFAALDDLTISAPAPASPAPDLAPALGTSAGMPPPPSSLVRQVSRCLLPYRWAGTCLRSQSNRMVTAGMGICSLREPGVRTQGAA